MDPVKSGTGVFYQAMPAIGANGKNIIKLIPVQMVNRQFVHLQMNQPKASAALQSEVALFSQLQARNQVLPAIPPPRRLEQSITFTEKAPQIAPPSLAPPQRTVLTLPRTQYVKIRPGVAQTQRPPAAAQPLRANNNFFCRPNASVGNFRLNGGVRVTPAATVTQVPLEPPKLALPPADFSRGPKQQLKLIPKMSQRPSSPIRWVIEEMDAENTRQSLPPSARPGAVGVQLADSARLAWNGKVFQTAAPPTSLTSASLPLAPQKAPGSAPPLTEPRLAAPAASSEVIDLCDDEDDSQQVSQHDEDNVIFVSYIPPKSESGGGATKVNSRSEVPVQSQREAPLNVSDKGGEPVQNAFIRQEEPTQNVYVRREEPAQNVSVRREEPAQNVSFRREEPAQNVSIRREEPAQNVSIRREEPAQNVSIRREEPAQNVSVRREEPAQNVSVRREEPAQNVSVRREEPVPSVSERRESVVDVLDRVDKLGMGDQNHRHEDKVLTPYTTQQLENTELSGEERPKHPNWTIPLIPESSGQSDAQLRKIFGVTADLKVNLHRIDEVPLWMISTDLSPVSRRSDKSLGATKKVRFDLTPDHNAALLKSFDLACHADYAEPIDEDFPFENHLLQSPSAHLLSCGDENPTTRRLGRTRKRTRCPCCIPAAMHPTARLRIQEPEITEPNGRKTGRSKIPRKDGKRCLDVKNQNQTSSSVQAENGETLKSFQELRTS